MEESTLAELEQAYSFFNLNPQATPELMRKQWTNFNLMHHPLATGAKEVPPIYFTARRHWRTIEAVLDAHEEEYWTEEKNQQLVQSVQQELSKKNPEYKTSSVIGNGLITGVTAALVAAVYAKYTSHNDAEIMHQAMNWLLIGGVGRIVLEKISDRIYGTQESNHQSRHWNRI